MLVGSAVRRVAIVGGIRIPFARAHGAYASVGNQDMLTAAFRGVVDRYNLQGVRLGDAMAGAVIKHSAASPELQQHEGRAVVFESVEDMTRRLDDEGTEIRADDVLVLRNTGPRGAPGMPEAGYLPIPQALARQGVKDMVRISDARMSGTAFGTVILHVTPESAEGGPLAAVRTGDRIRLDVESRTLDLLVDELELAERRAAWEPPQRKDERGYRLLHREHVMQANHGCDFDFLRGRSAVVTDPVTYL